MTNRTYNKRTVDLFRRLKPLYEEFKQLELAAPNGAIYTDKTLEVVSDSVLPFLEGETIQTKRGNSNESK